MWTRELLKSNAKQALQGRYWRSFWVCLVLSFVGLGGASANSGNAAHQAVSTVTDDTTAYDIINSIPDSMLGAILVGMLIGSIAALCWALFVVYPLNVGRCRYFMESRQSLTPVSTVVSTFRRPYGNPIVVQLLTNLKIALGFLLLIVPGIYLEYCYELVPYLLAENPYMSATRAMELSKEMMEGEKWNFFILKLSFFGWLLLCVFTFGIGGFFLEPYMQATYAEFYAAMRSKALAAGMTTTDERIVKMLRAAGKPVVLAVNKCDQTGHANPDAYEFYALGLGDPIEVSAVHGHGTGDLLDACVENFPPDDGEAYDEDVIKVAIIGKPNVGKSSLLNKILGEERVIVSNIAGTTRDAIDSYFENDSGKFLFIDTAGMRRKSKVDDAVEKYSNLRSIAAIERADVCLILIDANEGVTEQDTKVAGLAHEAGKACIIVVNKWDTVEKDTNTMDEKTAEIRRDLSYMTYAPVVFISALTGQRVDKLFDMIVAVSNQNSMRITTGMLNNILEDATARVQPPTDKGRRLKIYYITQVGVKPPHFVFFCNDSRLFHFSYQRYLENQIRAVFGLTGTPIKITIRQKGDKEDM